MLAEVNYWGREWTDTALRFIRQEKFENAEVCLRNAEDADSAIANDPDYLYAKGVVSMKGGDAIHGRHYFLQALKGGETRLERLELMDSHLTIGDSVDNLKLKFKICELLISTPYKNVEIDEMTKKIMSKLDKTINHLFADGTVSYPSQRYDMIMETFKFILSLNPKNEKIIERMKGLEEGARKYEEEFRKGMEEYKKTQAEKENKQIEEQRKQTVAEMVGLVEVSVEAGSPEILIYNQNVYKWDQCKVVINPDRADGGYYLDVASLKPHQRVGAYRPTESEDFRFLLLQFANKDGERFDILKVKPRVISVTCNTPQGTQSVKAMFD